MKRYRRRWLTLPCLGAILFSAHAGFAGIVIPDEVVVLTDFHLASGGMGGAYNAPDSTQAVGCFATANAFDGFFGECFATDRNGNTAHCDTRVPEIVEAILSLRDDSYLTFGWNNGPDCTFVQVENASTHEFKR